MTDNEIIKALGCCANADCLNCPKWSEEWYSGMCADFLPTALDLIKRQQAEIERLEKSYKLAVAEREANVKGFTEEIENLTVELKAMRGAANSYKLHYGNLRMEIAREVCDRVKETVTYFEDECGEFVPWVDCRKIDNLLKEMETEDGELD